MKREMDGTNERKVDVKETKAREVKIKVNGRTGRKESEEGRKEGERRERKERWKRGINKR